MKTHDLFLTASLIGHSLGEYQELVLKEAELRATSIVPHKVVPFRWQRDAVRMGATVAILASAVFWLPQWDPFGLHRQQKQLAEQRGTEVREISTRLRTSGRSCWKRSGQGSRRT